MPLVIGVLIVIVAIVVLNDKEKDIKRRDGNYGLSGRMTNATLERQLVDAYMKQGFTFRESLDRARQDIIAKGFSPCLEADAFGKEKRTYPTKLKPGEETSWMRNPEQYDSDAVKTRRELLKHRDQEANDANVYKNFPKNYFEYELDSKRLSLSYRTIPKGKLFTHPKYGTLEVIDYKYSLIGTSGWYVAKVLETGEIVNDIIIGDSQIRRL